MQIVLKKVLTEMQKINPLLTSYKLIFFSIPSIRARKVTIWLRWESIIFSSEE